jgi:catechol 2,3-dioxygenase-like lactoylglutathione lyase family enzyme
VVQDVNYAASAGGGILCRPTDPSRRTTGMNRRYRNLALLLTLCSLTVIAADIKVKPNSDAGPSLMGAALRSTDLDRSIKYYETGLGMVVTGKLVNGTVTEVFLGFEGRENQPGLVIFRDSTPGKSPTVDHGNAASRVLLRMPDVAAIAARLKAAGYEAGEVHGNGNVKVLMIKDPDGHSFELVQLPPGDVHLKGSMN